MLRFGVYLFMKDRIGDALSSISGHESEDMTGYYSRSFHSLFRLYT